MKTAEELAREYADETYPSADSNDYSRTTAEEWDACYDGYVTGYAEAMRWRDPKEFGEATDILKVGYDCHKCKHSFSNPFDQYYCQKIDENGEEYDLEADKDCKGIYYEC